MRPYSDRMIFKRSAREAFAIAEMIVDHLSDPGGELRCHEVVRVVSQYLAKAEIDHVVVDGKFDSVEHSWIVLLARVTSTESERREIVKLYRDTVAIQTVPDRTILDCYAVGALPQVQLLDASTWGVQNRASLYRPGDDRTDIREMVVFELVERVHPFSHKWRNAALLESYLTQRWGDL